MWRGYYLKKTLQFFMLSLFKVLPYDFFYLSLRQFHDLGDWSYSAQNLVLFDAQKPRGKLE